MLDDIAPTEHGAMGVARWGHAITDSRKMHWVVQLSDDGSLWLDEHVYSFPIACLTLSGFVCRICLQDLLCKELNLW